MHVEQSLGCSSKFFRCSYQRVRVLVMDMQPFSAPGGCLSHEPQWLLGFGDHLPTHSSGPGLCGACGLIRMAAGSDDTPSVCRLRRGWLGWIHRLLKVMWRRNPVSDTRHHHSSFQRWWWLSKYQGVQELQHSFMPYVCSDAVHCKIGGSIEQYIPLATRLCARETVWCRIRRAQRAVLLQCLLSLLLRRLLSDPCILQLTG